MTKKSAARLLRDAKEKRDSDLAKLVKNSNNTCWDDLNAIKSDCTALLLKHVHIAREINDKELIAAVADKETLKRNIQLLAQDLRQMTGELAEIGKQHEGKTGGAEDPDTAIQTFQIFEQYTLFKERHDGVIMPTVYNILEQVQQAENVLNAKRAAEQAAADATNPNVVTDVEFKETGAQSAEAAEAVPA